MYFGFLLAAYSVIANDVIQTLGTFLSSNENRRWWVLWTFAGFVLMISLVYGWVINDGDVTYGRLIGDAKQYSFENPIYPNPTDIDGFNWLYLLPPIILLLITRIGIPVSTSFLILTFFNPKNLQSMAIKSMVGYFLAFVAAFLIYLTITKLAERKFLERVATTTERNIWTALQWLSTAFLWVQWLIQDFANIYVFLPRKVDSFTLFWTLLVFLILLGYIFYNKGGTIQSIVKSKTNTSDIRSATIIDFVYGLVLYYFKELNNVPMSTTWVFIGLLAGRELGIKLINNKKWDKATLKDISYDLGKVFFGLTISVSLVYLIKWIT